MNLKKRPLHIYADGSCMREFEAGAWAWSMPALGSSASGLAEVADTTYCELRAVIGALREFRTEFLGLQYFPIIMSDCERVGKWLRLAIGYRRGKIGSPITFPAALKPLLLELFEILPDDFQRIRADSASSDAHMACHIACTRVLDGVLKQAGNHERTLRRLETMYQARHALCGKLQKLNAGILRYERGLVNLASN